MFNYKNIAFCCFILGSCFAGGQDFEQSTLEYNLKEHQYAVLVVIEDGKSSPEEVQKYLKKRAAEITLEKGYRYFVINHEDQVSVAKSNKNEDTSGPSNLYYDLIQEGDFGRQQLDSQGETTSGLYPAYRLVFTCYQDKPNGKAIDARSLVNP
jgi:hypothetical protein